MKGEEKERKGRMRWKGEGEGKERKGREERKGKKKEG